MTVDRGGDHLCRTETRPLVIDVVYLDLDPIPNTIYVSALSKSGTCYYLREINGGGARFASDPACGVADTQAYTVW